MEVLVSLTIGRAAGRVARAMETEFVAVQWGPPGEVPSLPSITSVHPGVEATDMVPL